MKKILLSIVIPAYNTEKYIGDCIESLVCQDLKECEIIIVDDGSTDRTLEICQSYGKKYDCIRIISDDNNGVSHARNIGLEKTRGDYVWFIDSDDLVKDGSIKTILNCLNQTELLVFGIEEFNKKKSVKRSFKKALLDSDTTIDRMLQDSDMRGYLFNKVFNMGILKKKRIRFDEKIKTCEDLLFCVECAAGINDTMVIGDVLYMYRQRRGGAIHSKINKKQATALDAFYKIIKYCKLSDTKHKAEALFVKAFYKYGRIIGKDRMKEMKKICSIYKKDWKFFSEKDKILILGYRYFHPLMMMLHKQQYSGKELYE